MSDPTTGPQEHAQVQRDEYRDESSFLWEQRSYAVEAPNYTLSLLGDLDEQLAAHLDGLMLEPQAGRSLSLATLDNGEAADYFVATVCAFTGEPPRFDAVLAQLDASLDAVPGVISGLGWLPLEAVDAWLRRQWAEGGALSRKLAIAACGLHRHDPGTALEECLSFPNDGVRIRALRTAGELGRRDCLPRLLVALSEPRSEIRFWAARSACLLSGDKLAVASLVELSMSPGRRQLPALQTALAALPPAEGHRLLRQVEGLPGIERLRIQGAGWAGDVRYAPWLIERMASPAVARIAFEAFVSITGADVNLEQLESMPPDGFEDGPTDDPDDDNVELPEDIALPWPDVERVKAWWVAHRDNLKADTKLFMGLPPSVEGCHQVLQTGSQRQRAHAAGHLCLLVPGQPLFPTSAPAWRQARLLREG